jgi:hypothetical protein
MYLQNVANCTADGMPKTCSRIGAAIAATIARALLLLGSASLAASALVRMGRIVDHDRILATVVHDGTRDKPGVTTDRLRVWLESYAKRALALNAPSGFLIPRSSCS